MIYVSPDYSFDFRCTADKCAHSCCIGWEIDIDDDTYELYMEMPGNTGRMLRENICAEPTPHFVLGKDKRCPFLRNDGLCKLILDEGEDILCDICALHPRFYNGFEDRTEQGIGMCCEEAARLLVEGKTHTQLIVEADEDGEEIIDPLFYKRAELFEILADDSVPLRRRFERMFASLGASPANDSISAWAELYTELERMDEQWSVCLEKLRGTDCGVFDALDVSDIKYERIAGYFIFRHMTELKNAVNALSFAAISTAMICTLDAADENTKEYLRLYSGEIEYSDENMDIIYGKMNGSPP